MKYVFDSSAIFGLVSKNRIELLPGSSTIKLAHYELGNIIWKEVHVHKRITEREGTSILSSIYKLLSTLEVSDTEEGAGVISIALMLGITFYDASYVYEARQLGVPLVTLDEKLAKKARGVVRTLSLDEALDG